MVGPSTRLHAGYTHTVLESAADLSYDPPGQLCSNCHVVSTWSEINDTEHNVATNGAGPCATCHNSSRQEVIDAINLSADPTICIDCHSNKLLTIHGNDDHQALGHVVGGTTNCLSCHELGVSFDSVVSEIHLGNCTLCHTSPPALIGGLARGECSVCHTGTWETMHPTTVTDHSPIVQVGTTSCASCHDDTLNSSAPETHNACVSCHDNTTGGLIGSAVGATIAAGGDCTTCHAGGFDNEHASYAHTFALGAGDLSDGTSCGSCHASANLSEITTVHDVPTNGPGSCATCHSSTRQEVNDALALAANPTECLDCHSATATAHGSVDHSSIVTVGTTGCASCHDDTLNSAAADTHNACTSCHDPDTYALIGSAVGASFATGGDCTTCHANSWEADHPTTAFAHNGLVTVGTTGCASCHDDTLNSAAADTHNACVSCHDVNTGVLIGSATGQTGTGDCTTCHTNTWAADHPTTAFAHNGLVTVGTTDCASCHDDTLNSAAADTHNACVSCHDVNSGVLIGSATGQTGAGDCTTCHTNTWEVDHPTTAFAHNGLVTVGTTGCASCHDDTLNSAAADTHNACVSCHDSNTGVLVGSATGKTGTGDCTTCHTGTWEAEHPNENDHSAIVVVGGTTCANCHDDTLISAAAETHNACASCHNPVTGALIGSAVGTSFSVGGDCTTCHAGGFDNEHASYAHTFALGAGDLSDGTSCGSCHASANLSEIATVHDVPTNGPGSCATCHSSTRQEVNDALALAANPTECLDCHSATATAHGSVDHSSIVTVGTTGCASCHDDTLNSAAADTHNACTSCHDPDTYALIGSAVGASFATGGDCTTCHANSWEADHPTTAFAHNGLVTVGTTGCASCHDDTLNSAAADTHNACVSCHDVNTGVLIGSATGQTGTGDCTTCHTNTWAADHPTTAFAHNGLVTVGTTDCASCHDDTLNSAAADTHNACVSCHDVNSGVLIGSATGQTGAGDCTTCHTNTWEVDHPTTAFAHNGLVTVGTTGCASCHDDTLNSAAADTHNACVSCHDSNTGVLVGSAIGKTGTGDCTTCHTGTWEAEHPNENDHSAIVVVGGTTCANCHDDTLISAAAETHNACASCHNPVTGALIGSAVGTSFSVGGDCTTCHAGGFDNEHASYAHTFALGAGDLSDGTSCGSCHASANLSEIATVHDVPTNGPGSCATCHSSTRQEVNDALALAANPTECLDCHSATATAHGSVDHSSIVTVGTTGCASCHDDTLNSAAADTHNACTSCHDPDTYALIGSAVGASFATGGDCTTCHANSWDSGSPDDRVCPQRSGDRRDNGLCQLS